MADLEKSGTFKSSELSPLLQKAAPIVSPRECQQHLQLLRCFLNLKRVVSETKGLFKTEHTHDVRMEQDPGTRQSIIKERRWSIYVSRAVRRFSIWWACLPASHASGLSSSEIPEKPVAHGGWIWESDKMPPLGKNHCNIYI